MVIMIYTYIYIYIMCVYTYIYIYIYTSARRTGRASIREGPPLISGLFAYDCLSQLLLACRTINGDPSSWR